VPRDGAAFHVVYVDANASLSPHEARLPQLLVALLAALAEEPRWDLRATRSGPALWERFRRIVGGLSEAAGELANAAGFPQLRALLKIDLDLARGFRKAAQDHLQSLISGTQDLIIEVTRALPPELRAIVFILDNLEKIELPRRPADPDRRGSVLEHFVERVGQADQVGVQLRVLGFEHDVFRRRVRGAADLVAERAQMIVRVLRGPGEPHPRMGRTQRVAVRGPAAVEQAVLEA
jgi:hypothetical protein